MKERTSNVKYKSSSVQLPMDDLKIEFRSVIKHFIFSSNPFKTEIILFLGNEGSRERELVLFLQGKFQRTGCH